LRAGVSTARAASEAHLCGGSYFDAGASTSALTPVPSAAPVHVEIVADKQRLRGRAKIKKRFDQRPGRLRRRLRAVPPFKPNIGRSFFEAY
jgi:hypothetical protein